MQQLENINILDYLPMNEADIVQYFGKIRNGKTYIATSDIIELLNSGQVVYANWRINWQGRDQREEWFMRLLGKLGLKKHFYVYPKENLKYLPVDENFFETFSKLTDCYVFLDEGHIAFNSYEMTRMQLGKQASILHTGHFDRAIRIISQRPTAIHVVMRANVNVFVECEKIFSTLGINIFRKTEYEEMTGDESVDRERPGRSKLYLGSRKIYEAYDTKYLRGNMPASQTNKTKIYKTKIKDWWKKYENNTDHDSRRNTLSDNIKLENNTIKK